MRAIALAISMTALTGLTACGGDDKLVNLDAGQSSPDEFAILPTKPINMPPDLNILPTPTPGGGNITDPTPQADAVAALGGNPAALDNRGIAASDQALVAYAGRSGTEASIRQKLAVEDQEWRSRNHRRPLERLAGTDVYHRAYREVSLDPQAELERWRNAGARTPSAPPPAEE